VALEPAEGELVDVCYGGIDRTDPAINKKAGHI
jgi:hypothetical protein